MHVRRFSSNKISSFAVEDELWIPVVILSSRNLFHLEKGDFQASVLQKCNTAMWCGVRACFYCNISVLALLFNYKDHIYYIIWKKLHDFLAYLDMLWYNMQDNSPSAIPNNKAGPATQLPQHLLGEEGWEGTRCYLGSQYLSVYWVIVCRTHFTQMNGSCCSYTCLHRDVFNLFLN